MTVPLISSAQVFMLSEGMTEPASACESLPDDLLPKTMFEDQQIRERLPAAKSFGLNDFRCCARLAGK